jgi:hypothetical protein
MGLLSKQSNFKAVQSEDECINNNHNYKIQTYNLHGGLFGIKKNDGNDTAMKAEKELCLQDIISFQKWREGVKERKRKLWFMFS